MSYIDDFFTLRERWEFPVKALVTKPLPTVRIAPFLNNHDIALIEFMNGTLYIAYNSPSPECVVRQVLLHVDNAFLLDFSEFKVSLRDWFHTYRMSRPSNQLVIVHDLLKTSYYKTSYTFFQHHWIVHRHELPLTYYPNEFVFSDSEVTCYA